MEPRFFSAKSKAKADHSYVVFVEGLDDAYFVDRILTIVGADPSMVGVVHMSGKDDLPSNINSLMKTRPFIEGNIKKIAIVRDADRDGQEALARVHSILRGAGLPIAQQGKFSFDPESVNTGVFIIPSANDDGDLEKFCLSTIAADERVIRAQQYLTGHEERFGKLDRLYKRQAAIFLACCTAETRGVGRAFFQGGIFNEEHPVLSDFKIFLKRLIGECQ